MFDLGLVEEIAGCGLTSSRVQDLLLDYRVGRQGETDFPGQCGLALLVLFELREESLGLPMILFEEPNRLGRHDLRDGLPGELLCIAREEGAARRTLRRARTPWRRAGARRPRRGLVLRRSGRSGLWRRAGFRGGFLAGAFLGAGAGSHL